MLQGREVGNWVEEELMANVVEELIDAQTFYVERSCSPPFEIK
jgi:hypothetical protein